MMRVLAVRVRLTRFRDHINTPAAVHVEGFVVFGETGSIGADIVVRTEGKLRPAGDELAGESEKGESERDCPATFQ